jgi:hypothetical protein
MAFAERIVNQSIKSINQSTALTRCRIDKLIFLGEMGGNYACLLPSKTPLFGPHIISQITDRDLLKFMPMQCLR